jgi:CheY-like chemotaxis protein
MSEALLIEAEELMARDVQRRLGALGLTFRRSTSGPAGIRLAREGAAVILIRVELPGASGFSVCNKLKRIGATRSIPIVLYTTDASTELIERHRGSGTEADAYVRVTDSAEPLVDVVRELVAATATSLIDENAEEVPTSFFFHEDHEEVSASILVDEDDEEVPTSMFELPAVTGLFEALASATAQPARQFEPEEAEEELIRTFAEQTSARPPPAPPRRKSTAQDKWIVTMTAAFIRDAMAFGTDLRWKGRPVDTRVLQQHFLAQEPDRVANLLDELVAHADRLRHLARDVFPTVASQAELKNFAKLHQHRPRHGVGLLACTYRRGEPSAVTLQRTTAPVEFADTWVAAIVVLNTPLARCKVALLSDKVVIYGP